MSKKPPVPQIDMAGVAARLEALRKSLSLSNEAFSLSFGLDPSSYTKVINNLGKKPDLKTPPKPLKSEYAFALSERWGVTMDFIYRGDLSKMDDTLRNKVIAALNAPDA